MTNVQYVTDSTGKPLYVQVPIREYEKLIANSEELADIAAYKRAKKKPGKTVSFEDAFASPTQPYQANESGSVSGSCW